MLKKIECLDVLIIMSTIVILGVTSFMFFGCSEENVYYVTEPEPIEIELIIDPEINELCSPEGFAIIFDGEVYTWKEAMPNRIYSITYTTQEEEAINSAIKYYKVTVNNWDRYLKDWEVLEVCY